MNQGDNTPKRFQILLPIYLFTLTAISVFVLLKIWPQVQSSQPINFNAIWTVCSFGKEAGLILVTLIAGTLGSLIHVLTSFINHTGQQRFNDVWFWWYIFRPPLGALLALVFFFAIQGGMLLLVDASGKESASLKPSGVASVAMLVGLFTQQATFKLKELFDTLFATRNKDMLDSVKVVSISPTLLNMGAQQQLVTLKGSNLEYGMRAIWDRQRMDVTYVSDSEATLILNTSELMQTGDKEVLTILSAKGDIAGSFLIDIGAYQ